MQQNRQIAGNANIRRPGSRRKALQLANAMHGELKTKVYTAVVEQEMKGQAEA